MQFNTGSWTVDKTLLSYTSNEIGIDLKIILAPQYFTNF